ncbi:bifunctional DNA primase/polymerase [Kineosporia mesophila]|uniref:Bifunctional DNA primase/polymerase n=1 Tax=Kineosporia mesophila TaxID=566012 RepID=A0ABP7A406_9ACTN|nr:bifunctional DNA primase/polymerase [Kineosporia mesophila]MCD5353810.1 bifunctional DNA primase/polymerase [Kineosporia mesophila]
MPRNPSVLPAALHAAGRGWPVFPLIPGKKFPVIRSAHPADVGSANGDVCRGECGREGHGLYDASTDPNVIGAWWRRWPRANYGINCGGADLVVVDLDTGKGTPPAQVLPDQHTSEVTPAGILDGADVLTWAAERAGAVIEWGDTLTVATPSGGTHLYYAAPEGVEVRSSTGHTGTGERTRITGLGWSVDVRAVGGYVVGPGSRIRASTDGYAAIIKGAVAPTPPWLLHLLHAIAAPERSGGPEAMPSRGATPARARSAGSPSIGAGYADAALTGELENIAASVAGAAGGSGRNATLNRAAYKLARHVEAGHLSREAVTAHLLAAGCGVGLSEREASAAIASGLSQGRARTHPAHIVHAAHARTPGRTRPRPLAIERPQHS